MTRPPLKRRKPDHFQQRKRTPLPNSNQTRQVLEKKLSHKPLGKRPQDSDDSDELITTRANPRGRKRQDIYASGGLAKGDKPGAYPTRAQRTRSMREDTEEILSQRSRSRSASRANSVSSSKSTPVQPSDHESRRKESQLDTIPSTSMKRTDSGAPISLVNGIAPTPQAEVSILGKIKPRKRQASILQRMHDEGANTSSILNSDDEENFLPDNISTPIVYPSRAGSDLLQRQSSLKRKRNADTLEAPVSSQRVSHATEQIAVPTRTQQRKLSIAKPISVEDDSVMAPPESSEDEAEISKPAVTGQNSNKAAQQRLAIPTTQQLKSLMPSNKHKEVRRKLRRGEFDISADSADNSGEDLEDENDHSIFALRKSRRTQHRVPARTKKLAVTETKTKSRKKGQSKSTKANPSTPPPVRIRTPLPLSVAKSGDTQAKSPSKQDTAMRDKPSNTPAKLLPRAKGGRKQYGGSRTAAAGKENQPIYLSEEASEGSNDEAKAKSTQSRLTAGPEAQAWSRKWADIDDFELDFEDVSVPTMSSSPSAR